METTDFIEDYVSKYFSIKSTQIEEKALYFIVFDYDRDKFVQLVDDLDKIGYLPFIDEHEGSYKINIVNKPEHKKSKVHLNILLLLVTIVTTISAGYLYGGANIINGIAFSVALLSIIGTHETAHYFATKKHDVKATLPYFIPGIPPIGTFGAVITVKSAIPTKNALFDLGVSGPIAGFIITVPVLIIGFILSPVAPLQPGATIFPSSILIQIVTYFTSPPILSGYDIYMHPVAFAGWIGTIITMLNLMPVAVLDGGHISRSLFNQKTQYYISLIFIIITFLLGWYFMAFLMILFILYISRTHPGALDNVSPLDNNRKIIAILVLVIFMLCLIPSPFVGSLFTL